MSTRARRARKARRAFNRTNRACWAVYEKILDTMISRGPVQGWFRDEFEKATQQRMTGYLYRYYKPWYVQTQPLKPDVIHVTDHGTWPADYEETTT